MTNVLNFVDTQGTKPVYEFDTNNGRDIIIHKLNGNEVFALMDDGFIRSTTGWIYRHIAFGLGDVAADSDSLTYPVFRAKHDITIIAADIGVDTDIVDDDTNYQTMYLEQTGSSTDIASLTSDVTWSKHVPVSMGTLDSDAKIVKAGQTVQLRFSKTASGKAMSGVQIHLSYSVNQAHNTVGAGEAPIYHIVNEVGTDAVIFSDHLSRIPLLLRIRGKEVYRIDTDGKLIGDAPDSYYYHVVNVGDIIDADGAAKISSIFKPHADVDIEAIYFGVNIAIAADSQTNRAEIKFTDNSGNLLASGFAGGINDPSVAMTKGQLYDVGEIDSVHKRLTSSEHLRVEYAMEGTMHTLAGLTIVIVFKKVA